MLNGPFTVTFRCVDARATRSVPRDSGYSVARPRFQYPMNDMSVFGTPCDSAAGPAGNVASPCEETSPATSSARGAPVRARNHHPAKWTDPRSRRRRGTRADDTLSSEPLQYAGRASGLRANHLVNGRLRHRLDGKGVDIDVVRQLHGECEHLGHIGTGERLFHTGIDLVRGLLIAAEAHE